MSSVLFPCPPGLRPLGPRPWGLRAPLLFLALLLVGACSPRKFAVRALADELSSGTSSAMTRDEDLELVGDAIPFALKLMETVREETPDHVGLHLALASGFTQYAAVYAQFPAEQAKYEDYEAWRHGIDRARRLFLRARGYAFDGLDIEHPDFSTTLMTETETALARTTAGDVPLLYWAGASWLSAISLSKEDPAAIGELPMAAAVLHRALELDSDWDMGSIHEALVSLEPALPVPGGAERAESHFERAVELSQGRRASPYVSLATAVVIPAQDRERFHQLMQAALDVDLDAAPDQRLANVYAQEKARFLLEHEEDLFVDEVP